MNVHDYRQILACFHRPYCAIAQDGQGVLYAVSPSSTSPFWWPVRSDTGLVDMTARCTLNCLPPPVRLVHIEYRGCSTALAELRHLIPKIAAHNSAAAREELHKIESYNTEKRMARYTVLSDWPDWAKLVVESSGKDYWSNGEQVRPVSNSVEHSMLITELTLPVTIKAFRPEPDPMEELRTKSFLYGYRGEREVSGGLALDLLRSGKPVWAVIPGCPDKRVFLLYPPTKKERECALSYVGYYRHPVTGVFVGETANALTRSIHKFKATGAA